MSALSAVMFQDFKTLFGQLYHFKSLFDITVKTLNIVMESSYLLKQSYSSQLDKHEKLLNKKKKEW